MKCLVTRGILLFIFLTSFYSPSYAQFGGAFYGKFIGFVTDENGEAVEKATVKTLVKGGSSGKTDKDGKFKIRGRIGSETWDIFGGGSVSIKPEPVKILVMKEGYKPFKGFVYPYYNKTATSKVSKFLGGGGGGLFGGGGGLLGGGGGLFGGGGSTPETGYVFVTPVQLVPSTGSEKSKSMTTNEFLQRYFNFEGIEYGPNIVTKKEKVGFKGTVVLPPDPGIKVALYLSSLTDGKRYKLSGQKAVKVSRGAIKQTASKEIVPSGKEGVKIFRLELTLDNLSSFLGEETGRSWAWFAERYLSNQWLYVLKCKDDNQYAAGKYFFDGKKKLESGEYEGAIADFEKAAETAPDFSAGYYGLAIAYQKKVEKSASESERKAGFEKVMTYVEQSLAKDKDFFFALLLAGKTSVELKEDKKARTYLDAAYKQALKMKDGYFYAELAEAYFSGSFYDKAKESYKKAEKLLFDPGDISIKIAVSDKLNSLKRNEKQPKQWYELGDAYYNLKNLDKAEEAFKNAASFNPKYAEAMSYLGLVYYKKGEIDKAIEWDKKAADLKPKEAAYHRNLALDFREKDMVDEEIKEMEAAAKLKKKEYEYDLLYSQARKKVKDSPDDAAALVEAAEFYLEDEKLEKAVSYALKAVELQKALPEAWRTLGEILYVDGRIEESYACLSESIRLKQNDAKAHAILGQLYNDAELYGKALKEFEAVIAIEKESKKKEYSEEAKENIKDFQQLKLSDNPSVALRAMSIEEVLSALKEEKSGDKEAVNEEKQGLNTQKNEQTSVLTANEDETKKENENKEAVIETIKQEELKTESKDIPKPEEKKDKPEDKTFSGKLPVEITGISPKGITFLNESSAPVQEGDILTVVRGEKTIGRIKILKINETKMQAEILEVMPGESIDFEDQLIK